MRSQRTCSDDQCDSKHYALGLCQAHYDAAVRHVDSDSNTSLAGEIWRPIPEYEDWYEASSLGRIRRSRSGTRTKARRLLRPGVKPNGYLFVIIHTGERSYNRYVHRLVASAFHGAPPRANSQVNHLDRVRSNNRASNLEWCSPLENMRHLVSMRRLEAVR